MALNKDGLEIGQLVDFATMVRVNKQRKAKADEPEPAKRKGRPKKKADDRPDESGVQDSSGTTVSEEA